MDATTRERVVRQLLDAHGSVLAASALRRAGLSSKDVRAVIAEGLLIRLRRDVLVEQQTWEASAPWERHALRARAWAGAMPTADLQPGGVALSHQSTLALHDVAVFAVDDLVHASRLQHGRGHRSDGLWVHSPVPLEHATLLDGMPVVPPALACLQVAAQHGVESGLVAADSAVRTGQATVGAMKALLPLACLKPGRPQARRVVELVDGRRESAGESRTAWLLHCLDLPRAIPQVEVRDPSGVLVARADFVLDGTRVVVEFDGRLKYHDHAALVAEKLREDRLRELGYEVVRLTWEDLDHPGRVRAKILAALARSQTRPAS